MKVGKPVCSPRTPYGRQASSVEAEEIHSGNILMPHVSPYIQFREAAESRQRRKKSSPNPAHMKRRNRDVSVTLKQIQIELRGHQGPDLRAWHSPMGKQQVVPSLHHDPRLLRQWDRPVVCMAEKRMHLEPSGYREQVTGNRGASAPGCARMASGLNLTPARTQSAKRKRRQSNNPLMALRGRRQACLLINWEEGKPSFPPSKGNSTQQQPSEPGGSDRLVRGSLYPVTCPLYPYPHG